MLTGIGLYSCGNPVDDGDYRKKIFLPSLQETLMRTKPKSFRNVELHSFSTAALRITCFVKCLFKNSGIWRKNYFFMNSKVLSYFSNSSFLRLLTLAKALHRNILLEEEFAVKIISSVENVISVLMVGSSY